MVTSIKQGDCLSKRHAPLFFDYTLKKDTLLKTCTWSKTGFGFYALSIRIRNREILAIIFLLAHPNIFFIIFFIFLYARIFTVRPRNFFVPSNEDMILAIIQIHPDS